MKDPNQLDGRSGPLTSGGSDRSIAQLARFNVSAPDKRGRMVGSDTEQAKRQLVGQFGPLLPAL